jgi:hypothetical protein
MLPVMLLDIDGVINAVTRKPNLSVWPRKAWKSGLADADDFPYPINWSTTVVEFLTRVHEEGRAEIRWHTTWQHDAQNLADLVGLPTFPIADAPEAPIDGVPNGELVAARIRDGIPPWWKYGAARRVVIEERRPLIWVDDDITHELSRRYRDVLGRLGPVSFVSPDQATGLVPRHLRQIEMFLDRWPGTPDPKGE